MCSSAGLVMMSGVKLGVVSMMSVSTAWMRWTKLVVRGWWNESAGASVFVSVNSDRMRCDPWLTVVRLMICINLYAWSIQSS
jgi:hypothetical protein